MTNTNPIEAKKETKIKLYNIKLLIFKSKIINTVRRQKSIIELKIYLLRKYNKFLGCVFSYVLVRGRVGTEGRGIRKVTGGIN